VHDVRHGQGRRLPGRPGRRRVLTKEAIEPSSSSSTWDCVQPHGDRARSIQRTFRRPHQQLRRSARPARLLRGRSDRPHDPSDATTSSASSTASSSSDEFQVVDLLFDGGEPEKGGRAAGVVAQATGGRPLHTFRAKAVLLATGGFGRSSGSPRMPTALPADGVALCYRHGIPLQDMEFFQFHRPGSWASASCCPRRRAAKAARSSTTRASGS